MVSANKDPVATSISFNLRLRLLADVNKLSVRVIKDPVATFNATVLFSNEALAIINLLDVA